VFVARNKQSKIEEVIISYRKYLADGGSVGEGGVYSDWNGVGGNILRQLSWWAGLGGKYGGSQLIGGRVAHRLSKSPREAGFLFSGGLR